MMDRKLILEFLRSAYSVTRESPYYIVDGLSLLAAADLLEAEGWVSIRNRQPEDGTQVFLFSNGQIQKTENGSGWQVFTFRASQDAWEWDDDEQCAVHWDDEWRPLPEPPGGDHD